jgi:hypothetical protein
MENTMLKKALPVALPVSPVLFTIDPLAEAATNSAIEDLRKDARRWGPDPGSDEVLVNTGLGASSDRGKYVTRVQRPGERHSIDLTDGRVSVSGAISVILSSLKERVPSEREPQGLRIYEL